MSEHQQEGGEQVLPVGTQVVILTVVTPVTGGMRNAGTVGVVVQVPETPGQPYRVAFVDGVEAEIAPRHLIIRKHAQRAGRARDDAWLHDEALDEHVIYRCIVGSRAYGLDDAASDTDRRGIYLPPAAMHWSLAGVPEQVELHATQECYWELQKFVTLALKANPNVLECLYTPLVERATPQAEELLALRPIFLSRLVYQTYNGYVLSQFKKLEQDLRTRGDIRWKHAMHLIRLLLSGIVVLRQGFVPLRVEEFRPALLAIRRGEIAWEEINAWRLRLHQEFDTAYATTRLPEQPDYERADHFLIKARRTMARLDLGAHDGA